MWHVASTPASSGAGSDVVGRQRVLVLESERLFADPAVSEQVLDWLNLAPHDRPFPVTNGACLI